MNQLHFYEDIVCIMNCPHSLVIFITFFVLALFVVAFAFSRLCHLMIQHSNENIKLSIFLLEMFYGCPHLYHRSCIGDTFSFIVDLLLNVGEFKCKLLELTIQHIYILVPVFCSHLQFFNLCSSLMILHELVSEAAVIEDRCFVLDLVALK